MLFDVQRFMSMANNGHLSAERQLDDDQLAVIRQIQEQKPTVKEKASTAGHHITVEDLLSVGQSSSESPDPQRWVDREMRIRGHHRLLLESVNHADLQTVNAPGFPKAAHSKNPTSTYVKPDMMIAAFTAGLTTQQAVMEMNVQGGCAGLFSNSFKQPAQSDVGATILDSLLHSEPDQRPLENRTEPVDIISAMVRNPRSERHHNGDVPPSVAALLSGNRPSPSAAQVGHLNTSASSADRFNTPPQNQKMRKPFFMPYICKENVERGLRNGDLIKGVLRINQRNFEEAYIDNPEGDDLQDIMILGVHDRNRALHGDVVVVRLKERTHWIVRDSLYEAWRSGHMKVSCDDNGEPLTVPPCVPEDGEGDEKVRFAQAVDFLPPAHQAKIEKDRMKDPVPVTKSRRYTDEQMLRLGAQNRRNGFHNSNTLQRKLNYRVLADMPDEDWGIPDACLQKTAEVVFIYEMKNCRTAVGQLKVMADCNRNWGLFLPNDSRVPRMFIPADQLPDGFFERPHDFSKFIFIARLTEWQATAQFARGRLYKSLGNAGDIDAETEGLLISNDVDTREFSHSALASLPVTEDQPWKIDEKEFKYRKDFRPETIFTIDPSTARDLDDALHIKHIDDCNGEGTPGWEVGVHIADVSHFLQANTELDKWAEHRATSVYLVHKVIPMLPRILCEELCSLNSGVDRLTFSVVWKMDKEANIKDVWFGRSIIHSCVKLAYDHAQDMIESPEKEFTAEELPAISNGKEAKQIKEAVLNLNSVAVILKNRRKERGALRLDAEKLRFVLDSETGLPRAVGSDERKEANFLVEEFMLLANQAVAYKIQSHFPDISLLRRHPAPRQKVLREMAEKCEILGYPIDIEDSHSIAKSLDSYYNNPRLRKTVFPVLVQFMMKCMQLAVYFASGREKSYHHYALNVDYYTHFTSPIRRYPDVIVHRLLAAALGYTPPPTHTIMALQKICLHCNDRKVNAKAVSDQSAEMFFSLLIREVGKLEATGIVIGVLDAAVDVYLVDYNIIKRVYTGRLKLARESRFVEGTPGALTLYWDPAYVDQFRNADQDASKSSSSTSSVLKAKKEKSSSSTSSVKKPIEEITESVQPETAYEMLESDEEVVISEESDEEEEEEEKGPRTEYEQTLTVFTTVKLLLTPGQEPVKFMATIIPTPNKSRDRRAFGALIHQKEIDELLEL